MGARLASISALVALLLFAGGSAVDAGRNWCVLDPILVFADGTRVQWLTVFPEAEIANLTGPVTYRFALPLNAGPVEVQFPAGAVAERVVISYDGAPYDARSGLPVRATVLTSARTTFSTFTTVSGNVARAVTFGGISNAEVRANVVSTARRWSPLIDAAPIVATFTVSSDATIDVP